MPQLYRSAVHLILIEDDKTLLACRANTGYMDGWYSVVAGHIEPGETVVEAAQREGLEEAGLRMRPEDVELVGAMHRCDGEERIDFFLRVHAWEGEIVNAEPDKCTGLRWFPLDGLPENTVPYVRKGLENYLAGVWFDSFGWEAE